MSGGSRAAGSIDPCRRCARAARRQKDAAEDAEGGGFTGAIQPKESDHLAAIDRERQIGDCGAFVIVLGQLVDFDHAGIPHPSEGKVFLRQTH